MNGLCQRIAAEVFFLRITIISKVFIKQTGPQSLEKWLKHSKMGEQTKENRANNRSKKLEERSLLVLICFCVT